MEILITCPPMIGTKEHFMPILKGHGVKAHCPEMVQTLGEDQLVEILPKYDGWIIGDDPATERVFNAGKAGNLKAAVKWGIGIDNVDIDACKRLGIPIINTPNMFGNEVADLALSYVLALSRETFYIDRNIRNGGWPKNRGISLAGKKAGIVGYGDIGRNTAMRLLACSMEIIAYDPAVNKPDDNRVQLAQWPQQVEECDFLVFTCSLNVKNYHMLNKEIIKKCKDGVRIVNVARGPLIDETELCESLVNGKVHSVALDVFEVEPLPMDSFLRTHPLCIFGSHNGSNTVEAVKKTNEKAIEKLMDFLEVK